MTWKCFWVNVVICPASSEVCEFSKHKRTLPSPNWTAYIAYRVPAAVLNCECIPETKSLGMDSRFLSSWLFELRMDRSWTKSQTLQTLSSGFTESKEEQLSSLALVGSWHYSMYFSFFDFWKIHSMYFSFSDLCVLLNVVSFHGQCFSSVLQLSSGGQILRYTTADVGDHWTSFQQMGISARCSGAYSRAITSYPGVRIAMLSCCSVSESPPEQLVQLTFVQFQHDLGSHVLQSMQTVMYLW